MQPEVKKYLDVIKPVLEGATAKQLFETCNELANNLEYRKQVEESINKTLPEGSSFYIDGAGIGHIQFPLYVSNQMGEIK